VTDWKEVAKIGTPDNMAYRAEMEKAIRALHPDVAEFVWVAFLLRGGPGEKCARPRQRSKNPLTSVSAASRARMPRLLAV
jgi:hypothetical protein